MSTPPSVSALMDLLHWHPRALEDTTAAYRAQSLALRALAQHLGGSAPGILLHQGPAALINYAIHYAQAQAAELARLRDTIASLTASPPASAETQDLVETIICCRSVGSQDRAAHPEEGNQP